MQKQVIHPFFPLPPLLTIGSSASEYGDCRFEGHGMIWFYERGDHLRLCPNPVILLGKGSTTFDSIIRTSKMLNSDNIPAIFLDISKIYHTDQMFEGF